MEPQHDVTCFACHGAATFLAQMFRQLPVYSDYSTMLCQTCDGTGVVPAWLLARHVEGARRRSIRIAALLTQQAMAVRLVVPVADYSKMEYGTLPWPEGSEAVFEDLEGI